MPKRARSCLESRQPSVTRQDRLSTTASQDTHSASLSTAPAASVRQTMHVRHGHTHLLQTLPPQGENNGDTDGGRIQNDNEIEEHLTMDSLRNVIHNETEQANSCSNPLSSTSLPLLPPAPLHSPS